MAAIDDHIAGSQRGIETTVGSRIGVVEERTAVLDNCASCGRGLKTGIETTAEQMREQLFYPFLADLTNQLTSQLGRHFRAALSLLAEQLFDAEYRDGRYSLQQDRTLPPAG